LSALLLAASLATAAAPAFAQQGHMMGDHGQGMMGNDHGMGGHDSQ
jgi:Spy/CpxP family protein refolding chaperone